MSTSWWHFREPHSFRDQIQEPVPARMSSPISTISLPPKFLWSAQHSAFLRADPAPAKTTAGFSGAMTSALSLGAEYSSWSQCPFSMLLPEPGEKPFPES